MRCLLRPATSLALLMLLVWSLCLSSPPRSLWTPRSPPTATATTAATTASASTSASAEHTEELVWLRLRSGTGSGGSCLGPYGFTACGDLSFWLLTSHETPHDPSSSSSSSSRSGVEYQLRLAPDQFPADPTLELDAHSSASASSPLCLTQKRHFSFHALPFLSPCPSSQSTAAAVSSARWKISPTGELYYVYRGVARCLTLGSTSDARTEKCSATSPRFDIITHMSAEKPTPFWTNTETGATFPRDIGDKLGLESDHMDNSDAFIAAPHVLLGGGTYAKNIFGLQLQIYTVGWYVDYAGATLDSSLRNFLPLHVKALQQNPGYYEALGAADCPYDRSLLVTFLVNVKTKTLLDGVVEDTDLSAASMEILSQVYKLIKVSEFNKGMQILFTWRRNNTSSAPDETLVDRLDIRIISGNGNLLQSLSLSHPGLARELFLQFVHPSDPVSPAAKAGFAANLHAALSADTPRIS